MMPWFPIRKRKGNATLFGQDLKQESPKIEVIIEKPIIKRNIPLISSTKANRPLKIRRLLLTSTR